MSRYDPKFDLKVNEGHSDLYCTVVIHLISGRVFDVQTSYLWIMSQYDPKLDLKVNVGHKDLHFTVQ